MPDYELTLHDGTIVNMSFAHNRFSNNCGVGLLDDFRITVFDPYEGCYGPLAALEPGVWKKLADYVDAYIDSRPSIMWIMSDGVYNPKSEKGYRTGTAGVHAIAYHGGWDKSKTARNSNYSSAVAIYTKVSKEKAVCGPRTWNMPEEHVKFRNS